MAAISKRKIFIVILLIWGTSLLVELHVDPIEDNSAQNFTPTEYLSEVTETWVDPDPQEYYSTEENPEVVELSEGVIVHSGDGIGNQLYRYACLYALAKDLDRPLLVYVPEGKPKLSERQFLPDQRHFVLDKFQIPIDILIDKTEKKLIPEYAIGGFDDVQLLFKDFPDKPFLLLNRLSYCQSESYWKQYKNEILSMFQFRPEVIEEFQPYAMKVANNIENEEDSVCVHVRRGDFAKRELVLDIEYQRWGIQSMALMLADRQKNSSEDDTFSPPKFFVFSDDIEYVMDELDDLAQIHRFQFVSSNSTTNGTNSLEDFYLMTKCKHFIIPNSTFGWWAAYLSTEGRESDGIVIVSEFPASWWEFKTMNRTMEEKSFFRMLHNHAFYPKSWIIYYPEGTN